MFIHFYIKLQKNFFVVEAIHQSENALKLISHDLKSAPGIQLVKSFDKIKEGCSKMKEWSFPICPCHKHRTVLENSLSLQTTCLIRSINFCCAPANYKRVENVGNLTKGGSQKNHIIWNLILSHISPKKGSFSNSMES